MTTETLSRPDAGLSTIEGIDLDLEPGCEHSQHDQLHVRTQPAWAVVRASRHCPEQGGRTYLICASGWLRMGANGVICRGCMKALPRDQVLSLVTVL